MALASSLGAGGGIARAETIDEAAKVFGSREQVQYISLSPSGSRIAYIAPDATHGEAVYVIDLAGAAQPVRVFGNSEQRADITTCDWANERRLVCSIHLIVDQAGTLLGYTRLVAIGADGSDLDILTQNAGMEAMGYNQFGGSILALDVEGKSDAILMTRDYVPERRTSHTLARDKEGRGVVELNIDDQKSRPVEPPDRNAERYIADETGQVRLMMRRPHDGRGNIGSQDFYYYRATGSDRWQEIPSLRIGKGESDFYPTAVDTKRNVAYGFAEKDGYDALYAMALDGSGKTEELLARNDVDVDRLIRIGRRNRVVGASYATEKRAVAYIDPEFETLAKSLAQALPGRPLIDIVDASEDEGKLLIVAASDTDPGTTYLLDRSTKQMGQLLPLRHGMADRTMGAMTPVTFPASDGTNIPAYLTLPPGVTDAKGLPAVVLPHGGPSARDEWGFDWLVQFFASQGYAVLQPNYRGSSGYGAAWFGRNGFRQWRTAIGDVNDAGRWLVAQGIANPDRLAIVGWSYGGYAALQSQVLDPQLYKAVVAIAPVTDLEDLRREAEGYTSYPMVDRFIGQGDHVASGSPARNAARFAAPVLLFHGTLDQNVGVDQSRRMKRELEGAGRKVSYTEFDELAHGLDDSRARTRMLAETARFLEQSLGR